MIDPITLEPIYKNSIYAVSIHKQLYCANSLIDSIIYSYKENIIPTIPHNREPYTEEILQNIYNKSDEEHKSEIIIRLMKIINFPIKIQKQIVCLTNKQQKIIFNCLDQKIITDKQIITIIELHITLLYVSNMLDKLIDSILESIDNLIGIIPKISDEILNGIIFDSIIKLELITIIDNNLLD
jgi:hypothetical protein